MSERVDLIKQLIESVGELHTFYWEQDNPRENELSYEIGAICGIWSQIKEIDRKKANKRKKKNA